MNIQDFKHWLQGYLEDKINKDQMETIMKKFDSIQYPFRTINVPFIQEYDPCNGKCDFPSFWNGIIPPSCRSCGKQASDTTITCNTTDANNTVK